MRMMGLDYGSRRVGVAVSDELGLTAQGVTTIAAAGRRRLFEELARIITAYGVETVVVGYPLRLDGSPGIQCEKVEQFARAFARRFSLPVILQDETLTTQQAQEILQARGTLKKRRKEVIDRVAAALILQAYLDAVAAGRTTGQCRLQIPPQVGVPERAMAGQVDDASGAGTVARDNGSPGEQQTTQEGIADS